MPDGERGSNDSEPVPSYHPANTMPGGMTIAAGQKIGRYHIVERLGAGGMGAVYRAYDEKLQRELAIKVLLPGTLDDPVARKRALTGSKFGVWLRRRVLPVP